jgi:hypothetical protein
MVLSLLLTTASVAAAQEQNERPAGNEACDPLLGMALVEVQDHSWGVEIRLVARDPADVPLLQKYGREKFAACASKLQPGAPAGGGTTEMPASEGSAPR